MTNSAPDAMTILKHTDDDGWAKHDSQCKVCGLTTGKWTAALAVGYRALEAELAETERGLEVQAVISYNAVARAEKAERELQEQTEFMWLNVRSHPEGTSCIDTDREVKKLKARVVELEEKLKDAVRVYNSLEAGEKEEC